MKETQIRKKREGNRRAHSNNAHNVIRNSWPIRTKTESTTFIFLTPRIPHIWKQNEVQKRVVVSLKGITPSRTLVAVRALPIQTMEILTIVRDKRKKRREDVENEDDRGRARGSVKGLDEEGVGTQLPCVCASLRNGRHDDNRLGP